MVACPEQSSLQDTLTDDQLWSEK